MIPNIQQQEKRITSFNAVHKVGDKIKIRNKNHELITATVWHPATMLVNVAVGWFDEVTGPYSLDKALP